MTAPDANAVADVPACVVHAPPESTKGEVRTQYAHAIDMMPTVLELIGLEPAANIKGVAQSPIEGVSFAHSLDNAQAESDHHTQYFEMLGHRSVYHDGWRAVCPWPGPSPSTSTTAPAAGRCLRPTTMS